MRRFVLLPVIFLLAGCGATLMQAVRKGDAAAARALMDGGADVNLRDSRGTTALHEAARRGDKKMLQLLLGSGASVNAENGIGEIPLYAAIRGGHLDAVKVLLEAGADVNFKTVNGWTPLHVAANLGNIDIARVLLAHNAGPSASNLKGQTPMGVALDNKHRTMAQLLKDHAALLDAKKKDEPAAAASSTPEDSFVLVPNFKSAVRPDDFAIVLGIENYKNLPAAKFAERDAEAVMRYMDALGVPRRNVIHLSGANAGRSGLEKYVNSWLPKNVKPDSRVYFYFSGHGAPSVKTGEAYIVPWDGDPAFIEDTGYPIKQLYARLSALEAKEVVIALDSCFSGSGGRSVLADGVRPLVTTVDMGEPPSDSTGEKLTLFTATSGNQITSTLENEKHGMFTYYFLRGLNGEGKDARGKITTQSLYRYLKPQVQDDARRQNREQSPALSAKQDVLIRVVTE